MKFFMRFSGFILGAFVVITVVTQPNSSAAAVNNAVAEIGDFGHGASNFVSSLDLF